MKKPLYIVLLFLSNLAVCQEYTPLLDTYNQWSVRYCFSGLPLILAIVVSLIKISGTLCSLFHGSKLFGQSGIFQILQMMKYATNIEDTVTILK